MGVVSIVFAIIGTLFTFLGLIIGILNWLALSCFLLAIIFSVVGILISKNKAVSIVGLVLSIIFGIISLLRLIAGLGIF